MSGTSTKMSISKMAASVAKRKLQTAPGKAKKARLACMTSVFPDLKLTHEQTRVVDNLFASNKDFHGVLVAHQTGSGKTEIIIGAIACAKQVKSILLVTTKSLVGEFKKRMQKYNFASKKLQVTTYAKYSLDLQSKKQKCQTSQLLIIDEVHLLRNHKSKRYKQIQACAFKAKYVLALTATPFVNQVLDVATLFRLVMTPSMSAKYSNAQLTNLLSSKTVNKLSAFKNRISWHYHDHPDLPRVKTHITRLDMPPAYEKAYQHLEDSTFSVMKDMDSDADKDLAKFYTALRTTTHKIADLESTKFEQIKQLLAKNIQTVLYSEFLARGIAIFTDFMTSKNISFAVVSGSTSQTARKQAIDSYNAGRIAVLVISKAGEVGLDLQGTRQIIFGNLPWNFATYEQIVGRGVRRASHVHLPANQRQVDVHVFIQVKRTNRPASIAIKTFDSIDDYLFKLIEAKHQQKEQLDQVLSKLSIK